jgi:hypothetical protein
MAIVLAAHPARLAAKALGLSRFRADPIEGQSFECVRNHLWKYVDTPHCAECGDIYRTGVSRGGDGNLKLLRRPPHHHPARLAAIKAGLKRFEAPEFPCAKAGHILRFVATRDCAECKSSRSRAPKGSRV